MDREWGGLQTSLVSRCLPSYFPIYRYVLGPLAMQRIQRAKVLLSGLQGLGAEVAKNLVLMGVGSLTLHDPHLTCWSDLAAQVRVLRGSELSDQDGDRTQGKFLGSFCTGSLPRFSFQRKTWKRTGLMPLKNTWLNSMKLFRFLSTQVTSQRTYC